MMRLQYADLIVSSDGKLTIHVLDEGEKIVTLNFNLICEIQ